MRFVKINAADADSKSVKRNCIAKAYAQVDKNTETSQTTKTLKTYFNGIKNEIIAFYNALNKKTVASALVAVAALSLTMLFNINFSFAYNAFIGDTELGYVPDKEFVQNCVDNINAEFAQYVSGEDIIKAKITYVPAIIRRAAFTDAVAVCENIKSTSDVMVQAYSVEVDDIAFAALNDKTQAEDIILQIASLYKTDDATQVSFKEDVKVLYEYVPSVIVMDSAAALERLQGFTTLYNTVAVDKKIAFADFAADNGLEVEYLKSLNPKLGEYINTSDTVVIPVWKPIITVLTTDTLSYETTVPFEEQVTEDATIYEGSEKILQAGANGITAVTEKIERANGAIVNQTVISSEVVCEPVMQMRAIGTKERPSHVGTGSFMRPYYGKVSSRFGSRRSGTHTGVDICGTVGDPIVAADNGTVIFSGWSGGYGKVIKIDHNNGYVTYYAHCNSLLADVGDVVEKGETIATLGSTGNSTGPHVHFEVRYNDEVQNPMNYVN
ncbi:MAG: peptidoglycan DD-metalloendopeptidase family protein [Clostridia bacterium]|nr:peptidoglycan DD-metalloendopeptidase family protein [Clostridia bacterium]